MNFAIEDPRDRLPPEMPFSEQEAFEEAGEAARRLPPVPSTLAIPLAARALGDAMFPRWAQGDAHAPRLLESLGVDAAPYRRDRASVFGVLARTAIFRRRAADFFGRHPHATGVVLGAGLSHYHQWLDTGRNLWLDADLPEVTALRQRWLPADAAAPPRRLNVNVDVTVQGWWGSLALPTGSHALPVLSIVEGLLMYLQPAQVRSLLHTFGECAPPGTRLLLDSLCWLAVGAEKRHPSVRHTDARFTYGLRQPGELAAAHPRLRLDAVHAVMEPYGMPYSLLGPAFKFVTGVPFYAVYELGVDA